MKIARWLVLVLLLCCAGAQGAERLAIGYLELENDPRYAERTPYARIERHAERRPLPGARTALQELAIVARIANVEPELLHFRGADPAALQNRLQAWREDGVGFVLVDVPGEIVPRLAARAGDEMLLFNVSAPDDALRGERCHTNVLHAIPSRRMQADALAQHLISRNWRDWLLLHGPRAADRAYAQAIRRAARRFGGEVVAVREFSERNDPRERHANNVALLTGGEDHDVIVVADTEGEFGRYVPYRSKLPRPVAGTTGLVPRAWSRLYERHGAPQVNERFEREAGREMRDADWAAWVSVKAILQAALRTRSTDFRRMAAFIRGEALNLDGAKGPALSFRDWNGQLRQPVFLVTDEAVVAKAPVEGFLHASNTLDTLGADAAESRCESGGAE